MDMIKTVIDLLNLDDFYGVNEDIDFAKGKYKYPQSINEAKLLLKRIWKSKK
jgi:hypothetical protein